MSRGFPGYNAAADFYAACLRGQPDSRDGAIWDLHDAIPGIQQSITLVANGYARFVKTVEANTGTALRPGMADALGAVWTALVNASKATNDLTAAFRSSYAEDIERVQRRDAAVLNARR